SPLNTDDHLRLEYNAPKHMYENTTKGIQQWVQSIPRRDFQPDMIHWTPEKMRALPGAWKYFYNKGQEAMEGVRYADALRFFKDAAALNDGVPEVMFRLGNAQEGLKQYDEAIASYEKLAGLKEWEIRYGCAIRRAKIRKKLAENPILERDVQAHNLIASLSYYMGDRDEALRSIDIAIHLDPYYLKNYEDMVVYYTAGGKEETARRLLEKAERLYGDKALERARSKMQIMDRHLALYETIKTAKVYIAQGRFEDARKILLPFADEMEEPVLFDLLADSESAMGDKEAAREHRLVAVAHRHSDRVEGSMPPPSDAEAEAPAAGESANPEAGKS
ncbi:MAG TPA: tetratricopeptide repeat protein, partial [Candidatus Eisenbacteria bacterium]|nr:tetratricopeptide repeat protein [Candidatus Eisenbacteria bacterium]